MKAMSRTYSERLSLELEKLIELLSEGLILTNYVRDEVLGKNAEEIQEVLRLTNNLNLVAEAMTEVDEKIEILIYGLHAGNATSGELTVLTACDYIDEISGAGVRRICVLITELIENLKGYCWRNIDLFHALSGNARTMYTSILESTSPGLVDLQPVGEEENVENIAEPVYRVDKKEERTGSHPEGDRADEANVIYGGKTSTFGENTGYYLKDSKQLPEILQYAEKPFLELAGSDSTPEERVFNIGKALRAYESAERAGKVINHVLDVVIDRLGHANQQA
jgi:hypothetical protein